MDWVERLLFLLPPRMRQPGLTTMNLWRNEGMMVVGIAAVDRTAGKMGRIQISQIIHIFDNSKLIAAHENHQRNTRRVSNAIFENYCYGPGDVILGLEPRTH